MLSTDRIATMKMGFKTTIQGGLIFMMVGCGAFLFTLMNAGKPDTDLVWTIGTTGIIAGLLALLTGIYTLAKAKKSFASQNQPGQQHIQASQPAVPASQPSQPSPAVAEELVECCSLKTTLPSTLTTLSYAVLSSIYAITLSDYAYTVSDFEARDWRKINLIWIWSLPLSGSRPGCGKNFATYGHALHYGNICKA